MNSRSLLSRAARVLVLLAAVAGFSSCRYYRQDIILQSDGQLNVPALEVAKKVADRNYYIRRNDWISVQIYTNRGEILIDPNADLARQIGTGMANQTAALSAGGGGLRYLVQADGYVNLPMVGRVRLDSLTYHQADSLLSRRFSQFYQEAFVMTRSLNRRVYYFTGSLGLGGVGAAGGGGGGTARVITLENERIHLFEVMAQGGGIPPYSKVHKIRIVRGDLRNPEVHIVNLRTIADMAQSDLTIFPGDIVYVEPGRRIGLDALRDIVTYTSLATTLLTLALLLTNR